MWNLTFCPGSDNIANWDFEGKNNMIDILRNVADYEACHVTYQLNIYLVNLRFIFGWVKTIFGPIRRINVMLIGTQGISIKIFPYFSRWVSEDTFVISLASYYLKILYIYQNQHVHISEWILPRLQNLEIFYRLINGQFFASLFQGNIGHGPSNYTWIPSVYD